MGFVRNILTPYNLCAYMFIYEREHKFMYAQLIGDKAHEH